MCATVETPEEPYAPRGFLLVQVSLQRCTLRCGQGPPVVSDHPVGSLSSLSRAVGRRRSQAAIARALPGRVPFLTREMWGAVSPPTTHPAERKVHLMVTTNQPPTQPPAGASDQSSAHERPTDAEVDQVMAWVDGVNGSAGHHLDDPYLRDLLRRKIAGEITGEEYDRLGMVYINDRETP